MKLLSTLFVLSLFGRSVFSHPLDLPFEATRDEIERLEKRATIVPVTGASGTTIHPRLEIRQIANNPRQWILLILALQQFQAQAQTSATSYYQISGIHGVPRQNYNNVGECSTCGSGANAADGYCTHDSVLFPAWHRAYIALYEQEFLSVVNSIANSWPTSGNKYTRAQMQSAAAIVRWPYWDWAAHPANGQTLPNVVTQSTVTINGPSGSETIANPLYQYTFADPSNLHYSPFVSWKNTLRYPTSDASTATSQDSSAQSAFNNVRASLQDQVYQLFSTCKDYLHFSNDDAGSSTTSCSNSLELIHNTVHTTAGGVPSSSVQTAGHMYYLATAAFDPVFWLHHTNVDRLFAMWQTVNPNSYGASQSAPHNTWTIAQGTTQNADSPLTPFYTSTSGTTFWTTNTVKDWANTFHYTYPEFADSNGSSSAIASYVNKLYGPSATATAGSSKRTAIPDSGASSSTSTTSASSSTSTATSGSSSTTGTTSTSATLATASPSLAPNGSLYQYVANIHTPRYALNGSYYVYLFLGPPSSEDPSTWLFDSNLVGPMGVLAQENMMMKNVTVAGSIPLTRSLTTKLNAGVLTTLAEAIVAPFLTTFLEWRIAGPNGTEINPNLLPGFQVAAYASTSTIPEPGCLPQWSAFVPLLGVTKTKAGGIKSIASS